MNTVITLPDGSQRPYDGPVTALQVAGDISGRLASAAVAARLDGQLCDLSAVIEGEHELHLVTNRDEQALEILRHSAAHVLAQAVVRLYGPKVQYTIGPALTDDFQYGFYYDFDLPEPISAEDLPTIEKEMAKIIAEDLPTERSELPIDQAKQRMAQLGQDYKVEMIDDLARDEGDHDPLGADVQHQPHAPPVCRDVLCPRRRAMGRPLGQPHGPRQRPQRLETASS